MPHVRNILFKDLGITATGDVIAAVPGKRIVVIGYLVTNTVATGQTITFRTTTTAISGVIAIPSSIGGGISWQGGPECAAFQTGFNEPLNIALAAGTAIAGHITYITAP